VTWHPDAFTETEIAVQAERIRATARRFDETTLAAAQSIRDAEKRLHAGTLSQADADAALDAASAVFPHVVSLVTLLAVIDGLEGTIRGALPELVSEAGLARVSEVLRRIDEELNRYFADGDSVHLTNALDVERQNLYGALRRRFGYWQRGTAPETVGADLDLCPERRQRLAEGLLAVLEAWVPGSRARLRGSLAAGTADEYSDIELCWVVPDEGFAEAVDTAGAAVSRRLAVLSFRISPELARPRRRRLIFIRGCRVPLFWRIDLDIRAESVAADDQHDVGNPDARSDAGWSASASAIENAVAAIKAAARGQADTAADLVRRGYSRIELDADPSADLAESITSLAQACAVRESGLTTLAAEVSQVVDHFLRTDG
jgi:hypothetical protein